MYKSFGLQGRSKTGLRRSKHEIMQLVTLIIETPVYDMAKPISQLQESSQRTKQSNLINEYKTSVITEIKSLNTENSVLFTWISVRLGCQEG